MYKSYKHQEVMMFECISSYICISSR